MYNTEEQGFTLIEIMIAVGILALLAAVAIPSYQSYVQKQRVGGAAAAAASWKGAVEECIQDTGNASGCTGGFNGIPSNILFTATNKPPQVYALTTGSNGVITVTTEGLTKGGVKMNLIFTPTTTSGFTSWTVSGTGCDSSTPGRGIDCSKL
ncbi:MAG: peptidase [Deltaproteobacteria bacterium]|nr:MAG: peptidase [Deltaproteobacteria bacterium]